VPEIVEAFSITGSGGDLLTRVVARDNAHLEGVIQRLGRLPGVVRMRTEIALSERVPHRVLPLVESLSPGPDGEPAAAAGTGPLDGDGGAGGDGYGDGVDRGGGSAQRDAR
jgi:hypothetical protein